MKRSTCKLLIGIGIFLILLPFIFFILEKPKLEEGTFSLAVFAFWIFIIAWWGWDSEERKQRKKEIHKAQIEALKTGKKSIELKGKMRKLK